MKLTTRSAKALAIFTLIIVMLQTAVAIMGQTLMPKQIVILIEVLLFAIIGVCVFAIVVFFRKQVREINDIKRKTEV
ncbi:MAG: hypothetical protein P9L91_02235 [Candidatus Zophobacter franzmannii]|nr:hypothetical protein [Candidatus Zophobacter franzmannii]